MFTGIVEGVTRTLALAHRAGAYRLELSRPAFIDDLRIGDSLAVNGVCLTAVSISPERLAFDMVRETVERSSLGALRPGHLVNLERSMPAGGRFHGHVVQGHVDGTGRIREIREERGQVRLRISTERALTGQLIQKGSVAIDGISLTIAELEEEHFSIAVIPHTIAVTTLHTKRPGDLVNLEADLVGKWVRRILAESGTVPPPPTTLEGLAGLGY